MQKTLPSLLFTINRLVPGLRIEACKSLSVLFSYFNSGISKNPYPRKNEPLFLSLSVIDLCRHNSPMQTWQLLVVFC